MARKQTLDLIVKTFQELGGNLNDVLGTRSNISFLGKGKSPELLFDIDVNPDALGVLPQSKAVEELTSSVGYALSNKLNDIQANKLLSNMQKIKDFYMPPAAPANITDLATGTRNLDKEGLMSLRAEEKLADDLVKNLSDAEIEIRGRFPTASDAEIKKMLDKPSKEIMEILDAQGIDLPPPGSRGGPEDIAAPFSGAGLEAIKNVKGTNLIVDDVVDKIYLNAGVSKNAQPVARANARDFLNRVKDLEDPDFPGGTTLSSMMEADDFKFMTEGGGGGMGDPLLLVQKYFGPKVATAVAKLDNADDIQLFAERLVKIKDGRGRSITDRMFNPDSVDPSDFEFADGGRVPLTAGGFISFIKNLYKGKKGLQVGRIEKELVRKYKDEGMDFIDAITKANDEANAIVEGRKLDIVNDALLKTDIRSDDYIKLIDEEFRLNDPESYTFIKDMVKRGRDDLADKTRALRFPDWAEANFGENYQEVLLRNQARALKQRSDEIDKMYPDSDGGIQDLQQQTISEIDEMNKANLDEILKGRKKNADGGRVGFMTGRLVGKALGMAMRARNLEKGGTQMGYQALRKYGIEGKDISRLFRELAMDKSLVGKEKTLYMQRLNQVLKNPDDFPEGVKEIQIRLGIDPIGFKGGGLAKILEV